MALCAVFDSTITATVAVSAQQSCSMQARMMPPAADLLVTCSRYMSASCPRPWAAVCLSATRQSVSWSIQGGTSCVMQSIHNTKSVIFRISKCSSSAILAAGELYLQNQRTGTPCSTISRFSQALPPSPSPPLAYHLPHPKACRPPCHMCFFSLPPQV